MKRLLGYLAGIGLGAAAGIVVSKRMGPPALGDKPRHAKPKEPSGEGGKFGAMIKRALEEGRRVMKQTEDELAAQVAEASDETR
jgi:hypothetical protein